MDGRGEERMQEEELRPSTFQEQGPRMLLPWPWGVDTKGSLCVKPPLGPSLAGVQPEAAEA